jgi:hypothetical protein
MKRPGHEADHSHLLLEQKLPGIVIPSSSAGNRYQKKNVVGLERGALSLVSTN